MNRVTALPSLQASEMNVMSTVANVTAAILICAVGMGLGCALQEPVMDGKPSFVHDVSTVEFAFIGKTKQLNCEVLNFCTITWYKNGIPYPWKRSDLHAHLEDRNQLLLFKDADVIDEGEYTCVASNGKQSVSRKISLWVIAESYNGPPFLLEDQESSCTNHIAKLGQTVSFYCKFYVGHSMAEFSSIGWMKVVDQVDTPIEVIHDVDYLTKENVSQNNSVISARLYVVDSKENAFGTWKVYAENGYSTVVTLSLKQTDPIKEDDEQIETAGNRSGEYSVTITLLIVLVVISTSLLFLVTGLFVRSLRSRSIIQAQDIVSDENLNQTKQTKI